MIIALSIIYILFGLIIAAIFHVSGFSKNPWEVALGFILWPLVMAFIGFLILWGYYDKWRWGNGNG